LRRGVRRRARGGRHGRPPRPRGRHVPRSPQRPGASRLRAQPRPHGRLAHRRRARRHDPRTTDPTRTSPELLMTNETAHPTVEALVARSNRLGADPKNTNYAGGNTSAKGTATDPVTGRDVE